ncbi:MAG: type II toxin-antitoxin system Phd/YefM family antitoxin [Anaerolineae bacterium]
MQAISVVEAKSRFSELISRASAGERFTIRRRERDVAVLISPGELELLERTAKAARRLALALGQSESLLEQVERGEAHPAMAAFGLWANDADLETLADEIRAERGQPSSRPDLTM